MEVVTSSPYLVASFHAPILRTVTWNLSLAYLYRGNRHYSGSLRKRHITRCPLHITTFPPFILSLSSLASCNSSADHTWPWLLKETSLWPLLPSDKFTCCLQFWAADKEEAVLTVPARGPSACPHGLLNLLLLLAHLSIPQQNTTPCGVASHVHSWNCDGKVLAGTKLCLSQISKCRGTYSEWQMFVATSAEQLASGFWGCKRWVLSK